MVEAMAAPQDLRTSEPDPLAAQCPERAEMAARSVNLLGDVYVSQSKVFGGGDGLFASRSFVVGERMAREPPIARMDAVGFDRRDCFLLADAYESLKATGQRDALLADRAGLALYRGTHDDGRWNGFKEWASMAWPEGSSEDHDMAAQTMVLFSYNAFASCPDAKHQVIYPTMSKVNHSCAPTCVLLAPDEGDGEMVCIRAIHAQSEITVSYLNDVDLSLPTEHRQALLKESWEFQCCCDRCTSSVEDARRFACPEAGCCGSCFAHRGTGPKTFSVTPCSVCSVQQQGDVVAAWEDSEKEVESLISRLPDSLYSSWAVCEDFSTAHPHHWLTGRWKKHLSGHTAVEASEESDSDEAARLRQEAAEHWDGFQRCIESVIGVPCTVPDSPTS